MKLPVAIVAALGAVAVIAAAAVPAFQKSAEIALPGPTRWDAVFVDPAAHRLYVAHGTQTDVVDAKTDKPIGTLAETHGVHDIAVAAELGLVFTSDGADNDIGVFDAATLQRVRTIKAGSNPDAIVYEPHSQHVIAFNGKSKDATIAEARTGVVVGTVALGGKPEFAIVGPAGTVYVHIEDTAEIAVLDASKGRVVKRYSIAPCEEPSGIALDPKGRLYSVCDNQLMVVSDPATGKVIGHAPIGNGPDGVVWLDGHAISANGRDGTATVVAETTPLHFEAVSTLTIAPGARTIAADPALHKLYLPTAEFASIDPASPPKAGTRRATIPDSFKVIVLQGH
jgi:YVTN family beta-propeller protein